MILCWVSGILRIHTDHFGKSTRSIAPESHSGPMSVKTLDSPPPIGNCCFLHSQPHQLRRCCVSAPIILGDAANDNGDANDRRNLIASSAKCNHFLTFSLFGA
ncbi:hypothetical protein Droror1_Dr00008790 [Drosera rotundifolia]